MKLNDRNVRALSLAEHGQYIVRDDVLPGFFVVVGRSARTFTAQTDVRVLGVRSSRRKALGRFPDIGTAEARAKAKSWMGQYQAGERKAVHVTESVTLSAAWTELRSDLEADRRSPRTIQQYDDCINRLLKTWLNVPLAELGEHRALVRARHQQLTKAHGPYSANRALASFRAVYNHALRIHTLPANPVIAVKFHHEPRKKDGMGSGELPAWFAKLEVLPNPIRREYHRFMLLSGSRPAALARARVEHLDTERRALHFPDPKGGPRRAFHMPLSEPMLACLERARAAGQMLHPRLAEQWLFPAASASGHIGEWKERRTVLPKHGQQLRRSYATLAVAAGIDEETLASLLNHKQRGVTMGYVNNAARFEQFLGVQERLSRFIMEHRAAPC